MGETVVDEDASWQGEYLRLVLQTAERGGEYQTVVVAFELGTVIMTYRMPVLLSQTTIGD